MRSTSIIFFLTFLFNGAGAQNKIDFGELPVVDSNYTWHNYDRFPISKLNPITVTKSILEIRVYYFTMMAPASCRILSFDGELWHLVDVSSSVDSTKATRFDTLQVAQNILELGFDSLKKNKIFTVANQGSLNLDHVVDDGVTGFILYKAGNTLGTYDYDNPCSYSNLHKEIIDLKYLCRILHIFDDLYDLNKVRKNKKHKHKK